MKKNGLLLAIVLLFAGFSAYADIELSAWGRAVVTPFAFSGDDSSVSAATNTWDERPRIGFSVQGISESERIGFIADLFWGGGVPGVGDNAKVWVRPFDFLKITAGWFNEDNLRGTVGNTEFTSWLLPKGGYDQDNIFTRFQATTGAHFSITPLEGLYIEAAFGSSAIPGSDEQSARSFSNIVNNTIEDVYKAIQVGAGYKIPEIGFARAQFVGNNRKQLRPNIYTGIEEGTILMRGLTKNRDSDVLEAAFQYSGLDGLNVDIGGKFPFEYETDTSVLMYPALGNIPQQPVVNADKETVKVQEAYSVAIGAVWTPSFLDSLSILVRADMSFGGWKEMPGVYRIELAPTYNVWVNPSYRITSFVRAGLDIGLDIKGKDQWQEPIGRPRENRTVGSDHTDFGIGAWVELQVGGGTVKTGVLAMIPGNERWEYHADLADKWKQVYSGDPIITIPISFTYSL
ncbi:MAG TPA: hypothetical protein DEQ14_04310 [Treponema sp.]|nr:hypothetical protein [Treponema sp.]